MCLLSVCLWVFASYLRYLLLSILRCKWLAILWRASLYSKCKPNLSSDAFFSTNSVISISILFPKTDERYWTNENMVFWFISKLNVVCRLSFVSWCFPFGFWTRHTLTLKLKWWKRKWQTWFEALNSSMLFAFNNARTNTTITDGLRKFVSTFNTRSVLFFSMASAKSSAVRSVSPTLVSDKTSKCSFSGNASNNCSNFSSEIF